MGPVKRRLPKITLKDLDWKLMALLAVLIVITFGDDFVLPVIGELLDPPELIVDAIVAYLLGKSSLSRAIVREEGEVVPGKVVDKQ